MNRLLSSIWLKVVAILLASLSLLCSFSIALLILENFTWFNSDNNDWYATTSMQSHNQRYMSRIVRALDLARILDNEGVSIDVLNADAITGTMPTIWDLDYMELSKQEEIAYLNDMYESELTYLNKYLEYFAITDGTQIIYRSRNLDTDWLGTDVSADRLLAVFSDKTSGSISPVAAEVRSLNYKVDGRSYESDFTQGSVEYSGLSIVYLPLSSRASIDGYGGESLIFAAVATQRTALVAVMIGSFILFALLAVYIFSGAGYRRDRDGHLPRRGEITLSWFDRIYLEPLTVVMGTVFFGLLIVLYELVTQRYYVYGYNYSYLQSWSGVAFSESGFNGISSISPSFALALFSAYGSVLVAATYVLTLVRRAKTRRFWQYSIIGRIAAKIKRGWQWFRYRLNNRPRLIACMVAYFFLLFIFFVSMLNRYSDGSFFIAFVLAIVLFVILPVVFFAHLIYLDHSTQTVTQYSSDLALGDEPRTVDADKLHPQFRPLYTNLQQLDAGLQSAVQRQLQADRLKTDLITNVSHDLKTPLTSIINYIDLLKREGLSGPDAESYLNTLDQKANRLKVLTEDLVEASKASSGNLPVEREWLDLVELLRQVNGEFEDKMYERRLALILRLPQDMNRYSIWSDGHHIWRILENLMENARKYSLEGSRVYLTLKVDAGSYSIQVKNISAIPLDLSTRDLMERFVRGDSARQTEGSGLGLSITQSLAELLGGRMELDVRDDVFTATVILPVVQADKTDPAAPTVSNNLRPAYEGRMPYPLPTPIQEEAVEESIETEPTAEEPEI